MTKGKPPDFDLIVWSPAHNSTLYAGVAWQNESGRIGIKLNAGVVLNWRDCQELGVKFMLKPCGQRAPATAPSEPPGGDEIPF